MDVYFDTNVYGHIYRGQHRITRADTEKLREAVSAGRLRILTSYTVIEETNTGRLTDLEDANGRLEIIRTLAILNPIIKHHPHLLEDDIKAYAHNNPMPNK